MKTDLSTRHIFVFDAPSPQALEAMSASYYEECQIVGAASVEIELLDGSTIVLSATRYLPIGVTVHAGVTGDRLQVACTCPNGQRVVMREFIDWLNYTVHRGTRQ